MSTTVRIFRREAMETPAFRALYSRVASTTESLDTVAVIWTPDRSSYWPDWRTRLGHDGPSIANEAAMSALLYTLYGVATYQF